MIPPDTDFTGILTKRFEELNHEIGQLQDQQKIIAGLLQNPTLQKRPQKMTKEMWSSILEASGYWEEDMQNWHVTFEKHAPEQHTEFLMYLQVSKEEIKRIKSWTAEPHQTLFTAG